MSWTPRWPAPAAQGSTQLFDLLRRGEIVSVKIGRKRLIPATSLDAYLTRLMAEQAGETP